MEQSYTICPNKRWSLFGMTAVVTGGTKGIGNAIVEELAQLGATVHTCSRNETELNERIQEWRSKGFKVSGTLCDITSASQREKLIQDVSSLFDGKLNILVNNVGTVRMKEAVDYLAEDYSAMMNTNFESPFQLCQLAYPLLKASGNASIVFVSSVAGVIALPGLSIYAASKGAINQLTKNLSCEWAKDNIRVNTVAPWATRTNIINPEAERDEKFVRIKDKYMPLIARTPLGRIAEPTEVSPVVAFLCLPGAASQARLSLSMEATQSAVSSLQLSDSFIHVIKIK